MQSMNNLFSNGFLWSFFLLLTFVLFTAAQVLPFGFDPSIVPWDLPSWMHIVADSRANCPDRITHCQPHGQAHPRAYGDAYLVAH
jgi:hypothetical protein